MKNQNALSRKIAVWISVIAVAAGGLAVAGAGYALNKIESAKGNLNDFIESNPESAAVVAYTIDAAGEMLTDGQAIFHNSDQLLVVASTMKIVVLAAYAQAVADGELDPGELIKIGKVERYYLPGTDGGAHALGLKSCGLQADGNGFANDPSSTVTLDDLARIMIHYSGNAETDYLLDRLGQGRMASVMEKAGLERHSPIGMTLGVALAMFNQANPTFSIDQLEPLVIQVSAGDSSSLDRLARLYLSDPQWRAKQIEFMQTMQESAVSTSGEEIWAYQAKASQLFPKGTAREYAQLMGRVASGNFVSPQVSEIMQKTLETVPSDWPMRLLFYDRFGAKDGVTAGVLSLAGYAAPKRGSLRGRTRVVVVIANSLPVETWTEQVQMQGSYLLSVDLAEAKVITVK